MRPLIFSLFLGFFLASNLALGGEFDDLAGELAPAIIKILPDEAGWLDNVTSLIEDKPQAETPSLAVILPDANLLPIAPELAKEWNDRLTAALLKKLDHNQRIEILTQTEEADILVKPIYRLKGDEVSTYWQALEIKKGRLLGNTSPFTAKTTALELSKEQMIAYQNAASIFTKKLLGGLDRPPKTICNAGLIHEESQTRPAFARTLADAIMAEMQHKGFDAITADKLPQFLSSCYDVQDGLRLSGNYWVAKGHINLTAKLSDPEGRGASYRGAINRATIPGNLEILPNSKTHLGWSEPISGALGLTLTSLKGDHPIYKVGEQLELTMSLTEAAFIHCYYRDSKGGVIKIFPNEKHPSSQFRAGERLVWPTLEMGFQFTLNADSLGQEELRCFATNQDITDRLPNSLRALSFDPIPPRLAKKLPALYNGQQDIKMDEARVVINVVGE